MPRTPFITLFIVLSLCVLVLCPPSAFASPTPAAAGISLYTEATQAMADVHALVRDAKKLRYDKLRCSEDPVVLRAYQEAVAAVLERHKAMQASVDASKLTDLQRKVLIWALKIRRKQQRM